MKSDANKKKTNQNCKQNEQEKAIFILMFEDYCYDYI